MSKAHSASDFGTYLLNVDPVFINPSSYSGTVPSRSSNPHSSGVPIGGWSLQESLKSQV